MIKILEQPNNVRLDFLESKKQRYFYYDKMACVWCAEQNFDNLKYPICRHKFTDLLDELIFSDSNKYSSIDDNKADCSVDNNRMDKFIKSKFTLLYYNSLINSWIIGYSDNNFPILSASTIRELLDKL